MTDDGNPPPDDPYAPTDLPAELDRAQLDFAEVRRPEPQESQLPPPEAALELDDHRPKPTTGSQPAYEPPVQPRPSAPAAVRSAARAAPLPEEKKKLTKKVLREGAIEVLLNSFSILREVVEDFRSSDKFFKYKALVLSCWLMLVATSVGVSCSGASLGGNSFGARLIVAGDTSADRVYMIKNDSDDEWQSVQITVNGKYYVTAAQIRPEGDLSLSPRLMFDELGKEAPPNLIINEIHLNCSEGDAFLLKDGRQQ